MKNSLLKVRALEKRFGGVKAVKNVGFDVPHGSITCLIGPNGAGKTTVFNLVSRLVNASSGSIEFDGKDLLALKPHHLASIGLGRTFQNLAPFKHASVIDNLLVGMHAHLHSGVASGALFWGKARREELAAREAAERIVEFLEIEEMRDAPVAALSYGLQKRVELGRALATRPRLLLLDEMVSGMNQEETEDIARFILDLRDEMGITVLMIEHDMQIVMDISDRVVVINSGELIADGVPKEVLSDPAVVAAYLGTGAEHMLAESV